MSDQEVRAGIERAKQNEIGFKILAVEALVVEAARQTEWLRLPPRWCESGLIVLDLELDIDSLPGKIGCGGSR